MLWLIPFLCSGAICWLNRDRIAAAAAPSRALAVTRPTFAFGARPLASPYLLPRAAAGYGSTPYGTGRLLLPPSPAASPFAYADPYTAAPAAPMPPSDPSFFSPMGQASASTAPTAPIALLRCSGDGCMIRPEPRAWDDATLGRMPGAFTAPKDFPVYVLSYGPVGWAHVLVNHPDEGAVEGWVETRSLTDAAPSPAPAPAPMQSPMGTNPSPATMPSTGEVANGRDEAKARHLEFMQKRGQGGGGRAAPPPQPPPRRRKR